MHYYQHNIGDYRRDTSHLSLLEHGVYRQLLDTYYLSEQPIPEETEVVFRRLSARTDEEKRAVEMVLSEFFFRDNGWHHKRCEDEIAQYHSKADRARSNGKLGGRPRKTKVVISGNPEQTEAKANHKPLTINQEPSLNTLSGKPDANPLREKNQEARESAKRVLSFLNEKTGRAYRPTPAIVDMIAARIKDGATETECRQIIVRKGRDWSTDEKMSQYLRPKTLFSRTNFENYLGELVA